MIDFSSSHLAQAINSWCHPTCHRQLTSTKEWPELSQTSRTPWTYLDCGCQGVKPSNNGYHSFLASGEYKHSAGLHQVILPQVNSWSFEHFPWKFQDCCVSRWKQTMSHHSIEPNLPVIPKLSKAVKLFGSTWEFIWLIFLHRNSGDESLRRFASLGMTNQLWVSFCVL